MTRERSKARTGWRRLDNLLILAGVVMLATFFVFKGWSHSRSLSGISAFEDARDATESYVQLAEPAAVKQGLPVSLPGESPWHADDPDTSTWSDKRTKEYQAAVALTRDAPQAVLSIDHLGVRVPVYNGADEFNLNRGVARILGTARVGQHGNLGIAGHRDGFFRPLKDIRVGDPVQLETFQGVREYRVSSVSIVEPTDVSVLGPSEDNVITLVTCYPFNYVGNAPQRYIVRAVAAAGRKNS